MEKTHQVNDINKKIVEQTYMVKSVFKGQELARRRGKASVNDTCPASILT